MIMLRHRAAAGSSVETRLLYSSRSLEDVIYRDELDRLVKNTIAKIFREDGITVLTATVPQQIEQQSSGRIQLVVRTPQGEQQLTGSYLLAAVGRIPNTEDLTLEATGIQLDQEGYIQVNGKLETNVLGIYALGDVKGGPAFTHVAYDDFRILRTNLLEHGNASSRDRIIPSTIFIDPQLGRVGTSENEARKQGRNIRVAKLPMNAVARALEIGETRGLMKAVIDAETQHIMGCAMLCTEGGDDGQAALNRLKRGHHHASNPG